MATETPSPLVYTRYRRVNAGRCKLGVNHQHCTNEDCRKRIKAGAPYVTLKISGGVLGLTCFYTYCPECAAKSKWVQKATEEGA